MKTSRIYNFLLFILAILFITPLNAQESEMPSVISHDSLIALGFPSAAVPAKWYFRNGMSYHGNSQVWTSNNIEESSLGDNYFSVCLPKLHRYEENVESAPFIDIWMYDRKIKNAKMILHQSDSCLNHQVIQSIDWAMMSTKHNRTLVQSASQKIKALEISLSPMIVISARSDNETSHDIYYTDILNPYTGEIRILGDEKFIGIASANESQLMAEEQDYIDHYIITTRTDIRYENTDIKDISDDDDGNYPEHIDVFEKNFLKTTINVYTMDGRLISKAVLPEERIDMIR